VGGSARRLPAAEVGLVLPPLLGGGGGRGWLPHPLEKGAARPHPAKPEDRFPDPADPLPARARVGEAGVLRPGEDLLQPCGVVARNEERRDDRPGRGAGDVYPLLDAGITLRGGDRPGEGDPLHAAALEDGVGARHLLCCHYHPPRYSTCSITQKSCARFLLVA